MPKKQKNKTKNIFTTSVILVAMFFLLNGNIEKAKAQPGVPQLTAEMTSVPAEKQAIWTKVTKKIDALYDKYASRAFQTAIRGVTYKFAQDTAKWVAAGGKGQKPLLFSDPGKFLRESGDQAAGDFLVKLSEGWPVDLCEPVNLKDKLAINIGISKSLKDKQYSQNKFAKQRCKLSDITGNFAENAKGKDFLKDVAVTFEPGKNPVSSSIAIVEEAKLAKERFEAAELIRRNQPQDTKALEDLITKNPTTPRELIVEAQRESLKKAAANPPRTESIWVDTFAVFTNTLTQTLLQKLASGYYPFRKTGNNSPDSGDLSGAAGSVKALLASFDVFSPQRAAAISTTGEIDLLSDMISCPPAEYQTPYNCLLNDGLQQAIQQGLTVQQALDRGLLDGNMPFPQIHDPNKPTLSLANLRKLRFLRVLPIGWEIAAARLEHSKSTKPLAHVISCFDGVNDGCGRDESSLIKLVDPKWVLALPQQYCRAEGFANVPETEKSSSRRAWCVDLQSCIKEDSSGNCEAFGYCTRERAVWKLQGESCDKQYATCQVLRRADGTTIGQGNTTGILGSDINKNGCTQVNAGCAWFSREGSGTAWQSGADKQIYLTNLAPACRAEDAGSREIIPLEPGTNLIRSTAARETVKVRRYTYYTLSFNADGTEALNATVSGNGLVNVSFSVVRDNSLILELPSGSSGRYAATFFNQGGDSVTVEFTSQGFTRAQLEEISFVDGQRAQAAMAANRVSGVEVLNTSPAASRNIASPATVYKPYAENRKLVFASARECSAEEASARKYTSVSGGEGKVARLAAAGLCSAACVGLDSYLAMPTPFEGNADPEAKSFIAKYAKACPAAEVGCEEFTNLSTERGAEQRSYFSQARSCVLDTNESAATFYTWEGTDTAGFQLKSWRLLAEEGTGAPCNNFSQNSTENSVSAVCGGSAADCAPGEANPNCRVFLDETGREFKRDVAKIVTASGECAAFRRSRDGETWYLLPKESKQCSSANAGCRQYKGARANVATRLLYSNFENVSNHGWSQLNNQSANVSPESVIAGKNSMRLSGNDSRVVTSNIRGTTDSAFLLNFIAKKSGDGQITKISLYEGRPEADFNDDGQINEADFYAFQAAYGQSATGRFSRYDINRNNIVDIADFFEFANSYGAETRHVDFTSGLGLTGDWEEYTLGPVEFNLNTASPVYILVFESTGAVYVDNIELISSPTQFYITQSTQPKAKGGQQPDACYNTALTPAPALYSRCEVFKDDNNNTFYVSRFAKLFSDDSAYCRAVIDTQNSNSAGPESFNTENSESLDDYTVAADDLIYRIIKPENLRPAATAGCTALGVPNDTSKPTAWPSVTYRIIDPDTFKQGSLCKAEGLGCQNFTNDQGETHTFRDPGKKLCAWDANKNNFVKINPATGQQTADLCYAGRTGDPATWYVAQCPPEQSSCAAYVPTDPDLTEGASSALFMRQNTVEEGNCKAGDGISSGCVNFTENYAGGDIPENKLFSPQEKLLSVKATRQCAEWLAPTTTSEVNDLKSRSKRTVVYNLGRCQELGFNGECTKWVGCEAYDKESGQCIKWSINYPSVYLGAAQDSGRLTAYYPGPIQSFNIDKYQSRNRQDLARQSGSHTQIDFYENLNLFNGGWDYSGYSAPNQYPLELLKETNIDGNVQLAYNNEPANLIPALAGLSCRSFPEEDAPFASDYIDVDQRTGKFLYNDATRHLESINKCEPGETCQCSYKKVATTEGLSRYYNTNTSRPFPDDIKSITDLTGWQGYCVEWDEETRDPNGQPVCLAWWPIDVVQNSSNIFDNHPEAGFTSAGPQYYCLQARGNKINSNGLVPIKTEKNNYLIRVNDFGSNFVKTGNDYPLWRLVDKGISFWKSAVGFALGGIPGLFVGGIADSVFDGGEKIPGGWENNSGLKQFKVKGVDDASSNLPLANLTEYDIESIVLTVDEHQAGDWPGTNDEIILRRDGFAKSTSSSPETSDRWTALWCGGNGKEECDFNGVYSWDKFMPFILDGSVTCGSDNIGETNLFALRARFADANGNGVSGWREHGYRPYQFLGIEGGLCDATSKEGWMIMGINLQLREWCTTVAAVNQSGENKAWTGRINQKSVTPDIAGGLFNDGSEQLTLKNGFGLNYTFNQDKAPFGAITPPAPTIYLPQEWDSRKDEEAPDENDPQKELKILEPGKQPLYVEAARNQVRAGSPYSCPANDRCIVPPVQNGAPLIQDDEDDTAKSLKRAVNYLHQLFAKVYNIWKWDEIESNYVADNAIIGSEGELDLASRANNRWLGQCPIVQAVVSQELKNVVGSGDCSTPLYLGYYSINGNDVIIDNRRTHALSLDWNPEPVAVGKEVALQFYAYNENGEQLPLRKIEIDWNDGIKTIVSGSFKNHKPICDNASQNYGDTSKACDPNLFEFKHAYTQTGSFIPVVTVWDNWGRFTVATYPVPDNSQQGVVVVEEKKTVTLATLAISSNEAASETAPAPGPVANGWREEWRNTKRPRDTYLQTLGDLENYSVVVTVARGQQSIDFSRRSSRVDLPGEIGTSDGEWFGVTWTGVLNVPAAGNYKFRLTSDDGSDLYIDNQGVINHGGNHPFDEKESEVINLYQGNHAARVRFYNNASRWGIKLEWKKPGASDYEVVPYANMLTYGTPLKVDGGWGDWSACSKTCGTGQQTRNCNNPSPANGGSQCLFEDNTTRGARETRNCNTQACSTPTPQSPSLPTGPAAPSGYTYCADEGNLCSFTGTRTVRYGSGTTFAPVKIFVGQTQCNNDVFGDPAPGTKKFCYYSNIVTPYALPSTPTPTPTPTASPLSGYTFCADEGNFCNFSGTKDIKYGSGVTFITKTLTNGTQCINSVFTDPTPGVKKSCYRPN